MAAFRIMPLAETTAILFITPLLVALLAGPLSRRKGRPAALDRGRSGLRRRAADRPARRRAVGPGHPALAGGGACYSIYQIQTRQLSSTESTVTMLFYTALVGTVVMTLALPWFWAGPTPGPLEALMIASLGIFGGTGHFLLTRAFRHAPASTLSPFMYAQLIWATLLGWLLFGELPDGSPSLGMTVIAGSGLAIALAERRRAPA